MVIKFYCVNLNMFSGCLNDNDFVYIQAIEAKNDLA